MSRSGRGGRRDNAGRPRTAYGLRSRHKDAALALTLIAWSRYGRPTTDEETEDVLAAIVMEERERIATSDE